LSPQGLKKQGCQKKSPAGYGYNGTGAVFFLKYDELVFLKKHGYPFLLLVFVLLKKAIISRFEFIIVLYNCME